ncbi:protein SMAX1-LIKE 4-like [Typha angustifolia]|uniref:protein SMAX1-LIKE 4-like n=1 Tax=Typha angustifolia TaxID=59011 RepID=UPI003C2C2828
MRTGGCTVHQALTAESATVLKLSLSLAGRRGHAQITPLHVAATLLNSSFSSNLLKRACLKSHHLNHPASHPLHCRALELCFNVALNRLPTNPPSSSGSLIHPNPTLSNALIAALKRAQAHQRRGCIELQQYHQQQQNLLAIKVELEQLIISILDDPSVSRVMREAGFSSTSVKNNLEEESSATLPPPTPFYLDPHKDIISHGSLWQTQFMKPPPEQNPIGLTSQEEDVRVVMEVMATKEGKRKSIVVVGDSVSITEGLVTELMRRVERGEVPDELKFAHFIKFQISYVHVMLMSKEEMDINLSELRRKVCSLASDRIVGGGVIIYVGDLSWAIDQETKDGCGFKAVEYLVGEVGRLLSDLKNSTKVWVLATATYQTYMRCQKQQPSLETQWSLQAVMVPSGGLELSLQAPPSYLDPRMAKLAQYPFQPQELKAFSSKDEENKLVCCAECSTNYEKEASFLKIEGRCNNNGRTQLPAWLQPHLPDKLHKASLSELRRKWNKWCQRFHHCHDSQIHPYSPLINQSFISKRFTNAPSHPWWSGSLPRNQSKLSIEATSKNKGGALSFSSERDASCMKIGDQDVRTSLVLGSSLFTDSATSQDKARRKGTSDEQELERRLRENIPWHSSSIASIVEVLLDCVTREKNGACLLMLGSDCLAKRRLALVISETYCGSTDKLVRANMRKSTSRDSLCSEILTEVSRKDEKCVVLIENIDEADTNLIENLLDCLKNSLPDSIIILTTSGSTDFKNVHGNSDNVIKMRMWCEETLSSDHKRKPQTLSPIKSKRPRRGEHNLDLNLSVDEENDAEGDEDAVSSDLTHVSSGSNPDLQHGLLKLVQGCITLDTNPDASSRKSYDLSSKLNTAFEEVVSREGQNGSALRRHGSDRGADESFWSLS